MIQFSFHKLTNREWRKVAKHYERLGYKVFVRHCNDGYSMYVWNN
jgi:hypothetical protein